MISAKLKRLTPSKFIRDILMTGATQVLVLILGMLFLKLTAHLLDEKHLGLFMLVRRWAAVLAPLLSLNLALGITKFVSSEKEKETHYLGLSFFIVTAVFAALIAATWFNDELVSLLLFNDGRYALLAKLFTLFVYADALYLIIYAVYRGRQQMAAANGINLGWFLLPVLLMAPFLFLVRDDKYAVLVRFYSLFIAAVAVAAFIYLAKRLIFHKFKKMLRLRLETEKSFLLYGLSRIPASLFLTLVFGIPVFAATHRISLEAAGYMGICVAVLRMVELASYPFNMIFLPKFSELESGSETGREQVREKSTVVVDFIVTVLPVVFAMAYGLAKYIVVFWFGQKYIAALPGLKILMLFSAFFLAYAMIRGILNGVFNFPYVNIICFAGFIVSAVLSAFFLGRGVTDLSLAFGLALAVLGVSAFYILVKKLKISPRPLGLLLSFAGAGAVFALLRFADRFVTGQVLNIYAECGLLLLIRLTITAAVFFLLWKRTLWYNELKIRLGAQKTHV